MHGIKTLSAVSLLVAVHSGAGTLSCETSHVENTQINIPYRVTPALVTIGPSMPDYTVIYSLNNVMVAETNAQCKGDASASVVVTLTSVVGAADTSQAGYIIYPTSVTGIGISLNGILGNTPIGLWPDRVVTNPNFPVNGPRQLVNNRVNIRLWKIPGDLPENESILTIDGPIIAQGIIPNGSSDSFSSETSSSSRMHDGLWLVSSRHLYSNGEVRVGTCNLTSSNKIVRLGKHPFYTRFSAWTDASFSLSCDMPAYGYGGSVSNSTTAGAPINGKVTANGKNLAPTVTVFPLTPAITQDELGNSLTGAFSIESADASGYGIQLAWGDYATQSSGVNPIKGVSFGTPMALNKLVNNYATTVNIGKIPLATEVKMAARFIQVSANVQPGQAKGIVEILVSYQ